MAKADPYDGKVASYGSLAQPAHLDGVGLRVAAAQRLPLASARSSGSRSRPGTATVTSEVGPKPLWCRGVRATSRLTGSQFASAAGLKSIWWTVRHASPAHDLNDNGTADVIARSATTG